MLCCGGIICYGVVVLYGMVWWYGANLENCPQQPGLLANKADVLLP